MRSRYHMKFERRYPSLAIASILLVIFFFWRQSQVKNETDQITAHPTSSITTKALEEFSYERNGVEHQIELDQYALRGDDGVPEIVKISGTASWETLRAQMHQLHQKSECYVVAYPKGKENDLRRRVLITNRITLNLPEGMTAQQLAVNTGLTLDSQPDYAPGLAVFTATDPLSALEKSQQLKERGDLTVVDLQTVTIKPGRVMPNDPLITNQWHLKYTGLSDTLLGSDLNVETAWNYGVSGGVKGTGIRIGIIDDGVDVTHPDFAGNIDTVNGKDWIQNDSDPSPQASDDDHGTSVAGVAAARGNNGTGVSGVAPEAMIVGLRLANSVTGSTDQTEGEAMAYRNDIIQIKNNSWGPVDVGDLLEGPGPLTLAAFQTAVTSGRGGKGTLIFWAGGNGRNLNDPDYIEDQSNKDGYANSIYTFGIGAMDSRLRQAEYSESGANLVCVTPSDGSADSRAITTTDRRGRSGYSTSDYANDFGGTSSATPAASGVAALMLEKNPNLGWRDVKEILIRSAKKVNSSDAGWANNSAGFHFHHGYGAGLIDATAAVNLAATWSNLAAMTSGTVAQTGLTQAIPDNSATGITRTFAAPENMRVEHVTIKVSITHAYRGDLEMILTAPNGMTSRLVESHDDGNSNYSGWTFSTVRHWGEASDGNWTLKIADRAAEDAGTLTAATLTFYGTSIPIPPQVAITSPSTAQVITVGQPLTIEGTASDTAPGSVTKVELFRNGSLVATDTAAPYSFITTPPLGIQSYILRATDNGGLTKDSAALQVTVLSAYDAWIALYPTLSNKNATADPDGDGFTNQMEFSAKTDPGQSASALRITSFTRHNNATQLTIAWQSVSGVVYQIQSSPNLTQWNAMGLNVTATGSSTSQTRTIPSQHRYFRVQTQSP